MPAPNVWAQRMADDLVEAGIMLGFKSTKEEPPVEDSTLRIDVVWKIHAPSLKNTLAKSMPIPEDITVISIEIQYSKSPPSISHGLIKAQYANSPYHIIVSYYPITEDLEKAYRIVKPVGLIILDGENFQDLQSSTTYLLSQKNTKGLTKEISQKVYKAILDNPESMEEKIRETIENEVKLLFTPMKIHEFYESINFPIADGFIISKSIDVAVKFIQQILGKYKFSSTIAVRSTELFSRPQMSSSCRYNYSYNDWRTTSIVISYNNFYFNDTDYQISFESRNAYVKSSGEQIVLWETIPTDTVKSFIRTIMKAGRDYMLDFDVDSNDLKELEQTISEINKLKEKVDS